MSFVQFRSALNRSGVVILLGGLAVGLMERVSIVFGQILNAGDSIAAEVASAAPPPMI